MKSIEIYGYAQTHIRMHLSVSCTWVSVICKWPQLYNLNISHRKIATNMQNKWSLNMPDLWDNWKIMRQHYLLADLPKWVLWSPCLEYTVCVICMRVIVCAHVLYEDEIYRCDSPGGKDKLQTPFIWFSIESPIAD